MQPRPEATGMTAERLFGFHHAFDHPVVLWITLGIGALLALTPAAVFTLTATKIAAPPLGAELWRRYLSWLVIAPLLVVPVLLGAAWTIGAVTVFSLLCFREYARATGLFRERTITLTVVLGIFAVNLAALDHWYGLFVALFPLFVGLITVITIFHDRPQGFIQRVALAVFAFMLFGCALSHLGYMANDWDYRPRLLLVLLAVQMNDVFAYIAGKSLGRRKLAPNTSPSKTLAGALGAAVLTTALVLALGPYAFHGTVVARTGHLVLLGLIMSIVGQLGDLTLSSIKRDLGIKDMAATIPGHGGFLDRFNSLLFVAPAVFHYVSYFVGFGLDQPKRIITG